MATVSTTEKTVLENHTMPTNWSTPKPKIIEFYGFEGEDFRYFKSVLDTFFSLTGITQDHRRVNILRTQLRRSAGVFFDKALEKINMTVNKISYHEAMGILQEHYITERLIQNYELAFNEMNQSPGESPQVFLSRLYEAADLADIQEEKLIHSRFRAGLLPAVKTFCREQSASSFEQWVKHADGWWNAHAPTSINLVENPFVPNTRPAINQLPSPTLSYGNNKHQNEKSVRFIHENVNSLRDVTGTIHKSNMKAYAGEESPNMAALTAKLEALDLHQLIPLIDSNEHINENIIQRENINSWKTDKGLKTFIKNIVQEVVEHDVKDDAGHNGYYETRKFNVRRTRRNPYYNKDKLYYDNDAASPGEGYYIPQHQYEQNQYENKYRNNYNSGYNKNFNHQPMRQSSYSNNYNQPYKNNYQHENKDFAPYRQNSNYVSRSQQYNDNNNYNHYNNYNKQGQNQNPYSSGGSAPYQNSNHNNQNQNQNQYSSGGSAPYNNNNNNQNYRKQENTGNNNNQNFNQQHSKN